MTTSRFKLKLTQRTQLRQRLTTGFPQARSGVGIEIEKENGVYVVNLDVSAFDRVNGISSDLSAASYVLVWNSTTGVFSLALAGSLSGNPGQVQQIITASDTVQIGSGLVAVNRTAPTATAIALPSIYEWGSAELPIIDWSTSVTEHTITLTPDGSETIMRAASWDLVSNAAQLSSITLRRSIELNGWYIAP